LNRRIVCLHRGIICLNRRIVCLHRGIIRLNRRVVCLHRGIVLLNRRISASGIDLLPLGGYRLKGLDHHLHPRLQLVRPLIDLLRFLKTLRILGRVGILHNLCQLGVQLQILYLGVNAAGQLRVELLHLRRRRQRLHPLINGDLTVDDLDDILRSHLLLDHNDFVVQSHQFRLVLLQGHGKGH